MCLEDGDDDCLHCLRKIVLCFTCCYLCKACCCDDKHQQQQQPQQTVIVQQLQYVPNHQGNHPGQRQQQYGPNQRIQRQNQHGYGGYPPQQPGFDSGSNQQQPGFNSVHSPQQPGFNPGFPPQQPPNSKY